MERYLKDKNCFRFTSSKELLDQIFLYEITRRVNNDATIVLFKKVYEVPQNLIKQLVTVRFDPDDLSKVFLKTGEPPVLVPVYPVQAIDNSKIIRKQNQKREIDFASLYGGGLK
jgi:hypothetical protein